jgi:hypothetical protein
MNTFAISWMGNVGALLQGNPRTRVSIGKPFETGTAVVVQRRHDA